MKTIRYTLSKTELVQGADGKWRHKVLKKEVVRVAKERKPEWEDRLLSLINDGYSYADIAEHLNGLGFTSVQGKRLTIDHLRNRIYWRKKNGL